MILSDKKRCIKHIYSVLIVTLMLPGITWADLITLRAGMNVEVGHDSNIYRRANNVLADQRSRLTPAVDLEGKVGNYRSALNYVGDYTFYRNLEQENTQRSSANASVGWFPKERLNLNVMGSYVDAFDQRGTTSAGIDPNSPINQWTMSKAGVKATVPGFWLRTFFNLSYDKAMQEYDTVATANLNNTLDKYFVEAAYAYSGKTFLVLDYEFQQREYEQVTAQSSNSLKDRFSAGMRWRVTGKSTNHFLLGYETRVNANASDARFNNWTVDIAYQWRRKSFSVITLKVRRQMHDDVSQDSLMFVSNAIEMGAEHFLTKRLFVGLAGTFEGNAYNTGREDIVTRASMRVRHQIHRRVKWGASASYALRDSTVVLANHNVTEVALSLEASY